MQSRSAAERREDLVALYKGVAACERCPLSATRTRVVFGAGNADADLMFVGEAPGQQEDLQGLPFVGRAGKLLDELLAGVGLSRDEVFITNVLKSRPPGNRDPEPDEIEACRPYLDRQIELIEPTVICTLGNFATKLLTRSSRGITGVEGAPRSTRSAGAPCACTRSTTRRPRCGPPRVLEELRADFAGLPALLDEPPPVPLGAVGPVAPRRPRPSRGLSWTCSDSAPWSSRVPIRARRRPPARLWRAA